MTTFEYVMIYIICWWVALFMVLPIAAKRPAQAEGNVYAAAPARTHIKAKLLGCTVLAGLFTGGIALMFHSPKVMTWLAGS